MCKADCQEGMCPLGFCEVGICGNCLFTKSITATFLFVVINDTIHRVIKGWYPTRLETRTKESTIHASLRD